MNLTWDEMKARREDGKRVVSMLNLRDYRFSSEWMECGHGHFIRVVFVLKECGIAVSPPRKTAMAAGPVWP